MQVRRSLAGVETFVEQRAVLYGAGAPAVIEVMEALDQVQTWLGSLPAAPIYGLESTAGGAGAGEDPGRRDAGVPARGENSRGARGESQRGVVR